MSVFVTEDCAGTGLCVAVAPVIFELNDDGLSTVITSPSTQELLETAKAAARLCPMAAIQLED